MGHLSAAGAVRLDGEQVKRSLAVDRVGSEHDQLAVGAPVGVLVHVGLIGHHPQTLGGMGEVEHPDGIPYRVRLKGVLGQQRCLDREELSVRCPSGSEVDGFGWCGQHDG